MILLPKEDSEGDLCAWSPRQDNCSNHTSSAQVPLVLSTAPAFGVGRTKMISPLHICADLSLELQSGFFFSLTKRRVKAGTSDQELCHICQSFGAEMSIAKNEIQNRLVGEEELTKTDTCLVFLKHTAEHAGRQNYYNFSQVRKKQETHCSANLARSFRLTSDSNSMFYQIHKSRWE